MGADMSEFELEEGVKKDLETVTKEETLTELFNRTMKGMTDILFEPDRFPYSADDLMSPYIADKGYISSEFDLVFDGLRLHGAKWVRNVNSNVCILYLHTNSRSVVDATEVIPLASVMDANVLAYDLSGSGKSGGNISLSGVVQLEALILYLVASNPAIEILIWARAISTQLAIEYMSSFYSSSHVKFLVLDTPFATVEDIVMEAATKIPLNGVVIPSVFIKFAVSMVRKSVKEQVGTDPYELKPIKCAKLISTPTFILTADDDPYVSEAMSAKVANAFSCDHWHRSFPGDYFQPRDHCVVLTPLGHIMKFVESARSRSRSHSRSSTSSSSPAAAKLSTLAPMQNKDVSCCGRDSSGSTSSAAAPAGEVIGEDTLGLETVARSALDKLPSGTVQIPPVVRTVATWTPDEKASKCALCKATFGVMRFRHHCRCCGDCLCDQCCSTKRLLLHVDLHTPVRICHTCVKGRTSMEGSANVLSGTTAVSLEYK
jgi:hypothetical protein